MTMHATARLCGCCIWPLLCTAAHCVNIWTILEHMCMPKSIGSLPQPCVPHFQCGLKQEPPTCERSFEEVGHHKMNGCQGSIIINKTQLCWHHEHVWMAKTEMTKIQSFFLSKDGIACRTGWLHSWQNMHCQLSLQKSGSPKDMIACCILLLMVEVMLDGHCRLCMWCQDCDSDFHQWWWFCCKQCCKAWSFDVSKFVRCPFSANAICVSQVDSKESDYFYHCWVLNFLDTLDMLLSFCWFSGDERCCCLQRIALHPTHSMIPLVLHSTSKWRHAAARCKKMISNLDLTKNKITRNLDHGQLVGSLQTQRESEEAGTGTVRKKTESDNKRQTSL